MEYKLEPIGNSLYIKGRIGWKGLKKSEYLENGEYRIINGKSLTSNGIDWNECGFISKERYEESPEIMLETNDIVITKDGTIGKVDIVKSLDKPTTVASGLFVLRNSNPEEFNTMFIYYFLKSPMFKHFIDVRKEGSVIPHLYQKDFVELEIPKFHINKQKLIARILGAIDNKIGNNKQIIANLEELSQTLFKRWFVDFEFPDENGNPYKSSGGEMIDSELGEIPSGWKVDELGNYIKIKSGKRPKNKVDKKDIENVVPIIGASKIMGYTNDYLYNEKIIIIGRVGTHGVIQRFSTRTWPSDNTFVIISDFESIIYQVLKSIDYISLNRGSTQPLLSQKDIKNTKVAMPTNETLLSTYQKENNHILKMMDQKNIENQKLTQLRDTLLPKLMSGEIEIPDDIEVNEDELSI
ncbi:restriction endonuclease subunit S [Staphylococcus haemolyticus]|uniref:restriction endonuclease subunit S n=1 Tax=Staphylococcus haemolyticus TaxID=1283 RepID=UPI001F0AD785|nr:restriction endonuclease subunit S [Staphylococcus haemolyticus]MCH4390751.1 restriction endonuclease subunit S [Staphylococcus haemolyticus]